ncbi:MAG TPA: VanZ family protein [Candidatus Eubacterium avistercoris]|uniref:VanZ family protein n=1 Tax=Candidatus Eubacterium avistercoris TaxID=2838567 RepID=A0A9D2D523_9FIRM|nr:VanZ family protein [Candidatus Eubacterium avistercoris]
MRENKNRKIKIFCNILFGVYLVVLFYFLFFAEMAGRMEEGRTYRYNLILFKEITRFIKYHDVLGWMPVFQNLIGNILIFLPFGMLVPILSRRYKKFWCVTLLSFELSLAVELIQLITKTGSCDVDDILLNTAGGMIGFACYAWLRRRRRKHDGKQ